MPWDSKVIQRLQGRRILVTGHTGFKGAWLSLWLESLGAEVAGLSLPPEPDSLYAKAQLSHRWSEWLGDIRTCLTVQDAVGQFEPELIFHLAAQPLVSVGFQEPVETFETNVLGTMYVLEAARLSRGVLGCVVITTDKVYRPQAVAHRHVESDPLGAHDPYSASKAAAEHVVDAWRSLMLRESGAVVTAARAGNVIGGGDSAPNRLVPDLVRAFAADRVCNVRNPCFTRPWQHVLDPLSGYLAVAARILEGLPVPEALNFGPDREETVSVVADLAAESWGEGAAWMTAGELDMPETPLLALDSGLARQTLNWRPTWTTQQAVSRTIDWWKKEREGASPVDLCRRDIADFMMAQEAV